MWIITLKYNFEAALVLAWFKKMDPKIKKYGPAAVKTLTGVAAGSGIGGWFAVLSNNSTVATLALILGITTVVALVVVVLSLLIFMYLVTGDDRRSKNFCKITKTYKD